MRNKCNLAVIILKNTLLLYNKILKTILTNEIPKLLLQILNEKIY